MTEVESTASSHNEEVEQSIDVELLIAEVKRRPLLYSKSQTEYLERVAKQKLWTEVGQAVYTQWKGFNQRKKREKVRVLQTKWRMLKDRFLKKFGGTRKLTIAGKKKKKYHFNSLAFLIPQMAASDVNISGNNNESEFDYLMDALSNQKTQEDMVPSTSSHNFGNIGGSWEFIDKRKTEMPPPMVVEQKHDDMDEYTHFSLMLVPMMKRFNEEQVYEARTGILRLMREISVMGQKKICVLQEELKYSETEASSVMQEVNNPEVGPSEEEAVYEASPERPRNEEGDIQYPETDQEEDVEV